MLYVCLTSWPCVSAAEECNVVKPVDAHTLTRIETY